MLNTNFAFVWPRVPQNIKRFSFSLQAYYYAYLILSPNNKPFDDDSSNGIPKIGNISFWYLMVYGLFGIVHQSYINRSKFIRNIVHLLFDILVSIEVAILKGKKALYHHPDL